MRKKSIKIFINDEEEKRLLYAAGLYGFTGRGAIVSYFRHLADLEAIKPGAQIGNQNKKGKTKDGNTND